MSLIAKLVGPCSQTKSLSSISWWEETVEGRLGKRGVMGRENAGGKFGLKEKEIKYN